MAIRRGDTAGGPDNPRDAALDRVYAAGEREDPPSRIDAAILAAARREVGAAPRPLGSILRTWRVPVALAAVLVLSFTVVLLMREEGALRLAESPAPLAVPAPSTDAKPSTEEARTAQEAPHAAPQAAAPPSPKAENASGLRDAPAGEPSKTEEDRREQAAPAARSKNMRGLEAPREAPGLFNEAPGGSTEQKPAAPETQPRADALQKQVRPGVASEQPMERAEREQEPVRPAPPPPAVAAPDAAAGAIAPLPSRPRQAAPESRVLAEPKARIDTTTSRPVWQGYEDQPPEKWLERVEELHRAGRSAEARSMLAEFRKRFPQYPVPATLDR